MLGLGKTGRGGAQAATSAARCRDIYNRHAAALYRQALLMLGDPARAESVACEVIADECALAPVAGRSEDEARYRLAAAVFRRSRQLATDHEQQDRVPRPRSSPGAVSSLDPGGLLSQQERGALGLVLFGGFGYVDASTVLGVRPREVAALVRTALLTLTPPAAAAARPGHQARTPATGGQ
jgi:hypothetical protein